MVLPGFNTDFKYKGLVYHVQTEDNGIQNPVVVTLLYLKGAILASKRTSYSDLLDKGNHQNPLMDLMKAQHRGIMKEVLAGVYDSAPAPPGEAAAPVETEAAASAAAPAAPVAAETAPVSAAEPKSLDEAIMDFLDQCSTGVPGKAPA